jgi:indolepyruvate ferredoxin oxidoreductase, beta subunit
MVRNIVFTGVGGQGLIMMTKIVSQAALKDGFDIKSNDVVGISQRGGMVWGNVRIGEKIYSSNIPVGEGDVMVALEPLEALRWSHILKEKGIIILNTKKVYPTSVQQEKEQYPGNEINELKKKFSVFELDATELAIEIGKKQISNTIMLGVLSNFLDIKQDTWKEVIRQNVPYKLADENLRAFEYGKSMKV